MAIVLTKKKKVDTPPMSPELGEIEAFSPEMAEIIELIDRVGTLQEEAAPVIERIKKENERLKPYKDALKELQAKVDEIEADEDAPIEQLAHVFRLEAGAKGTSRSVKDKEKAKKFLGAKLFMELAQLKLGDLDKYLTPPQLEEVLEIEPSSRSIKVIRRADK